MRGFVHDVVSSRRGDRARAIGYAWIMFGIDLASAAFLPAALVAGVAGLLSFLSPCVLPIVPPYLAYMGGVSMGDLREGKRSAVVPAVFFVLGLSTVFLFMGFAASTFGRFFLTNQVLFGQIAGVVIIVLGLHFIGLFRIAFLDREARLDAGDRGGSSFGAYVLGLAFAFGWTPCIGPQLGAILSLAAQGGDQTRGTALLAVYAMGLGIPFLLAAIFIQRAIGVMNRLKPYMGVIEKVMGGLLILVGLLMLTNAFSAISFWLLDTFPWLARLG
ncbi:cytochrome c-type biogenesis protein [Thioclava dalianensis]|nr:cytochrome c-type biogenesis protein [Thioclava dalianensis]